MARAEGVAGWDATHSIEATIVWAHRVLEGRATKGELIMAAQSLHRCRAQLGDIHAWARHRAPHADDLRSRVSLLLRVLDAVEAHAASDLRIARGLLVGGDPGEVTRDGRLPYTIRVVSGGAPGLGHRR
jgi:hypothetical protein